VREESLVPDIAASGLSMPIGCETFAPARTNRTVSGWSVGNGERAVAQVDSRRHDAVIFDMDGVVVWTNGRGCGPFGTVVTRRRRGNLDAPHLV
jgi:hypothetical protein